MSNRNYANWQRGTIGVVNLPIIFHLVQANKTYVEHETTSESSEEEERYLSIDQFWDLVGPSNLSFRV